MKIGKKLLSFLLAMSVSLSAMQMTAWMEELPDDYVSSENSQVTNEVDYTDVYNVPAVMSLLPQKTDSISLYFDNSTSIPQADENGLIIYNYSVDINNILTAIYNDSGLTSNTSNYLLSLDNINYFIPETNIIDDLTVSSTQYSTYGLTALSTLYIIIGSNVDDQLASQTKYTVHLYFKNYAQKFIENLDFTVYDNGTAVQTNDYSIGNYHITNTIDKVLTEDSSLFVGATLPSGYSTDNVTVYNGLFSIGQTSDATDITDILLGNTSEKLELTNTPIPQAHFTFVIDENGTKIPIPVFYSLQTNSITLTPTISSYLDYENVSLYNSDDTFYGYKKVYEASDFNDLSCKIKGMYTCNGTVDNTMVSYAYYGKYASRTEAVNAKSSNVASKMFSKFSSTYSTVDFSMFDSKTYYLQDGTEVTAKTIEITVIDKKGNVFNKTLDTYYIIDEFPKDDTPITPDLPTDYPPSDYTYFYLNRVYTSPYKMYETNEYLNGYFVDSDDDSYVNNDFITMFLLNSDNTAFTGNEIYPDFTAAYGSTVRIDQTEQTSRQSAVPFESGKSVKYVVTSESKNKTGNYWVTFLTQQQGAKLFVNATNNPTHVSSNGNPKREVMFNDQFGYYHDILIANIGDTELTGLNVKLSDDATAVKLDPYWTIIDSSVKKLAPFTTTSNNRIDNIAKIRLIPVDEDGFGIVSGTLTISADNGDSKIIDLVGIAGIPTITTDDVLDGTKYVPYSCILSTNNIYGDSSMLFSYYSGNLPDGLKIYPNGEIYGVPTEAGEFTFTVKAKYTGIVPVDTEELVAYKTYTINIADNTDENVDATNEDEQGYSLEERVSKYVTVYYNGTTGNTPNIDRIEVDSDLFWSEGDFAEFEKAFYIDGKELMEGTDYSAEEGSTKITVHAQTFANIPMTSDTVPHTLAAEFRTDSDELRRSAQNVYIKYVNLKNEDNSGGNNDSTGGNTGSNSGNGSSSSGNVTVSPNVTTSGSASKDNVDFGSVTAMVRIVDADGNAVPNLSVELHSSPKYATTDKNGVAEFSNVEFGRHTLYIKDPVTNKKISKKFTLVSGFDTSLDGNIITAEIDEIIYLKVSFSDSEITLLSAGTENVSTEAGIFGNDDVINSTNSYAGIAFIVSILLVGGFTVFAVTRRNKA